MSDPVKAIARRIGRRCAPLATTQIRHQRSRPWRSLLFSGERHHIGLSLCGAQVEAALDALEQEIRDADFTIAGHIVAELRLVTVDRSGGDALVTLDALTIDEEG